MTQDTKDSLQRLSDTHEKHANRYGPACVRSRAGMPLPGRSRSRCLLRRSRRAAFLYVAVPGAGNETEYRGVGILVYDIDNGHKFVKRIPTWPVTAGQQPELVRGIAASARDAPSVHQHGQAPRRVRPGDGENRLGEDLRRHLLRSAGAVSRWRHDLRAGVRRAEVVRDRRRERCAAGDDRHDGVAAPGDFFARRIARVT